MRRKIVLTIVFILMGEFLFLNTYSDASQNDDIQALTKFLINRANENYLYTYKKNIKNNSFIKHYFVNTDNMINQISFDALIVSRGLLVKCVKDDLENMLITLMNDAFTGKGDYDFVFQEAFINKDYILFSWDKEITINKFISYCIEFRNSGGDSSITDPFNDDLRSIAMDIDKTIKSMKTIKKIIDIPGKLNEIDECITKIDLFLEKYQSDNKLFGNKQARYNTKVIKRIKSLLSIVIDIGNEIKVAKNDESENDKSQFDSIKVVNYLLSFFNEFDVKSNSKTTEGKNNLDKFKKFALFMTLLSESKTEDEKIALLNAYVIPPVSFESKRNESFNFSISSYLGGAVYYSYPMHHSDNFETGDYAYYRAGFFAPIGLECSKAFDWEFMKSSGFASHGLLFSFVDVGEVVNSQLYNQNDTFNYRDIFYPGIFYVIGIRDNPVSFGLGVRYHSAEFKEEIIREGQALIFIAFDMPLFPLY